jgi:hypothetical protein
VPQRRNTIERAVVALAGARVTAAGLAFPWPARLWSQRRLVAAGAPVAVAEARVVQLGIGKLGGREHAATRIGTERIFASRTRSDVGSVPLTIFWSGQLARCDGDRAIGAVGRHSASTTCSSVMLKRAERRLMPGELFQPFTRRHGVYATRVRCGLRLRQRQFARAPRRRRERRDAGDDLVVDAQGLEAAHFDRAEGEGSPVCTRATSSSPFFASTMTSMISSRSFPLNQDLRAGSRGATAPRERAGVRTTGQRATSSAPFTVMSGSRACADDVNLHSSSLHTQRKTVSRTICQNRAGIAPSHRASTSPVGSSSASGSPPARTRRQSRSLTEPFRSITNRCASTRASSSPSSASSRQGERDSRVSSRRGERTVLLPRARRLEPVSAKSQAPSSVRRGSTGCRFEQDGSGESPGAAHLTHSRGGSSTSDRPGVCPAGRPRQVYLPVAARRDHVPLNAKVLLEPTMTVVSMPICIRESDRIGQDLALACVRSSRGDGRRSHPVPCDDVVGFHDLARPATARWVVERDDEVRASRGLDTPRDCRPRGECRIARWHKSVRRAHRRESRTS